MRKGKVYVGIDPGFSGGISIIDKHGVVDIIDMPLDITNTGKVIIKNLKRVQETKSEIDPIQLHNIFSRYTKGEYIIEKVSSMPEQGVVSVWNFAQGYGTILGVLGSIGVKPKRVPPSKWKADLKLNSDKHLSIQKALELYPDASNYISLRKHDGRAESLLLAHYLKVILKA